MSPRRAPVQQRSRQRVADIVNAALILLREGGVERCTMAALAEQAAMTPPSLYRYFPDASAVIHAVAEQTLEAIHLALIETLSNLDSEAAVRAALLQAIRLYHEAFVYDRALRELWAGTYANPALLSLNIADSRRNGQLIAACVAPWTTLDPETLQTRSFLVAHLAGAGITLTLDTPPEESQRLLVEIEGLMNMLFTRSV